MPTLDGGQLKYSSKFFVQDGRPNIRVIANESLTRIELPTIGIFDLGDWLIDYYPKSEQSDPQMADAVFQSTVLPVWLEAHGYMVLHASAVWRECAVIGFLAQKEGGKSTLAASFIRAGYSFVTDDILVIKESEMGLFAFPGQPRIKLWPEAIQGIGLDGEPFKRISSGVEKSFASSSAVGEIHERPALIKRLYFPKRSDQTNAGEPIRIDCLPKRDQLIALIRNFYIGHLSRAFGYSQVRMQQATQLLEKIEVRTLNYPNGFKYLPDVIEAVENDLKDKI